MFSYQRYRAVIHSGFPLGIPFLRFCRLENFHRISKSFQAWPFGLQNPPLSIPLVRLSLHWVRIALTPTTLNKNFRILEFWRNHNGFPKLPIITRPKPNPLVIYIEVIIWLQEDMNYMFSWHWKIISLVHCVHSWENRSEFARNAKIMWGNSNTFRRHLCNSAEGNNPWNWPREGKWAVLSVVVY